MSRRKDELRPEYPADLIKSGVRGKYAKRARKQGSNIITIDPDLRDLFPDSASVNKALREYVGQRKQPGR
jgi:hypothetical protein